MPESMFLVFNPIDVNGSWAMDKLGEWVDPHNVILGGSQHMHAIQSGISSSQLS